MKETLARNTSARRTSCAGLREITRGRLEKAGPIKYSVVVPFYNEEESICPLYMKIVEAMDAVQDRYEMIFVDDGSTDRSAVVLAEICDHDSRATMIQLLKNFGQTAALQAGFDFARGEIVISLDGDLQHDPAEIPRFIAKIEEGYDLVSGWRIERTDSWLIRQIPSRVANWMMSRLSRVKIHDFGTTFKAYRREILQGIRLYGDHHRFIPALAGWSGARIAEIPIKNIPRQNGNSNYGLSRTPRVFLDLISIKFLLDYVTRPSQFFGMLGLLSSGIGTIIALALFGKKVILHAAIMGPALFIAMLLILGGIQLLSLGLLGEMITRCYYESQGKRTYVVRQIGSRSRGPNSTERADAEPISNRVG